MNLRHNLRDLRRSLYELAGDSRYSRPASYDLDAKLARYLTKRGGVFIEAGANDGFTGSNTYYLEAFRDWTGILVEGIPQLAEKARHRRPRAKVLNYALVPLDYKETEVEMIYGDLMSLVVGAMGSPEADSQHIQKAKQHNPESGSFTVKVPCRSLSSILDECGVAQVDFLSLDVEGFEAQALQGIDFRRHRPEWLLIEARHRLDIECVISRYYTLVEQLTPLDIIYKLKY